MPKYMEMVVPVEENEKPVSKNEKEYLICYTFDVMDEDGNDEEHRDWALFNGREDIITFLRGIVDVQEIRINYDESFVLVDDPSVSLGKRLDLKTFIDHINKDLEDDPIQYE